MYNCIRNSVSPVATLLPFLPFCSSREFIKLKHTLKYTIWILDF